MGSILPQYNTVIAVNLSYDRTDALINGLNTSDRYGSVKLGSSPSLYEVMDNKNDSSCSARVEWAGVNLTNIKTDREGQNILEDILKFHQVGYELVTNNGKIVRKSVRRKPVTA